MRFFKSVTTVAILLMAILLSSAVNAQSYANQVWDQLQEHYDYVSEYEDYYLVNYIIGAIDDGESDTWNFPFESSNDYIITAACDYDCSDIDITIQDSYGNVIAEDVETDDQPFVEFSPRSSGVYEIVIEMYECSANPCYFGFGVFVK